MTKLINSLFVFILLLVAGQSVYAQDSSDPLFLNRDLTIKPSDNFFLYANGGWFKKNPIPGDASSNGIWKIIRDTINSQIKRVCEEAASELNAPEGSSKQMIGDFYMSGMDTDRIEVLGIAPLMPELKRIDEITDLKSLMKEFARLRKIGVDLPFGAYIGQDEKNSSKYILSFYQGGLSLGEKEYYFSDDESNKMIRSEFVKHTAEIFKLAGVDPNVSIVDADAIMNIETELAGYSRALEDLRDPEKNYNKMTLQQFNSLISSVDWNEMLNDLGVYNVDTVIVGQPEFFTGLEKSLNKFSINEWKAYSKNNLLNAYASYLSKAFVDEDFNFFSTILYGVKDQKPRWKKIVDQTNSSLGDLVGQVYVSDYLPAGTKEKLLEIGNNIKSVYAERIKKLDWMSDPTKKKALAKLSKVYMKVGYPDKWKDMSSVKIDEADYVGNIMRIITWKYNYRINKYGKPVDRTEWGMSPQTYNAYYSSSNNEIVVPASNIIVPGFEGKLPDDAVLYGIVGGSTFGHEITHGFDDEGRKFDEFGNLNDWWTAADKQKFEERTKRIISEFNDFKIDSLHVNGSATQGENIADLGGVVMGLEAFKKTRQYKDNIIIAGMTPLQRYFNSYAYAWMTNERKQSLVRLIMTDVHAPPEFRVLGPLSNITEFYKAFNIKEGDRMWRPENKRVEIW
ncbi:M13 family metallopeptidase [soil metagenome]